VLNIWLYKNYFSTSKFSYLLFCNPIHKTETGTAKIGGESTNNKTTWTNHYDSLNQRHWAAVRSYSLHSFQQVQNRTPFTSHSKQTVQLCWAKTIFTWAKPACFDFFFIQFCCAGSHTEHHYMSQTSMFWFFFIQFCCVGSHTEHHYMSQTSMFWIFFHPILLCRITYWAPLHEPNQHVLIFLHPILLCRITYWAPLGML